MRIKLDWQGKALVPMPIIQTEGLNPGAIKLFIILLDLREEDRDIPHQEIASLLCYSIATVRNYVQNLVETGWVKKSEDGKILRLRMHKPLRRK